LIFRLFCAELTIRMLRNATNVARKRAVQAAAGDE
jgi:hypothetical protein